MDVAARLTPLEKQNAELVAALSESRATIAALQMRESHLQNISAVLQSQVDERIRVELALRESEARYRSLLNTAEHQKQELHLMHQVRSLVACEVDLHSFVRTVVDAIHNVFGYTLVSLYLCEGDTLVMQHQVGYATPIHRIPITTGVMARVVRTEQPILIEDTRYTPDFIAAGEHITSEVAVPLFDQGIVVGVLNIESNEDPGLNQDDLRLMTALSQYIGLSLDRTRLFTALQDRETRLRILIANLPAAVYRCAPDEHYTAEFLSEQVEQITGYPAQEFIHNRVRSLASLIYVDDQADVRRWVDQAVQRGAPFTLEYRIHHADGTLHWVAEQGRVIFDEAMQRTWLDGVVFDITERKQSEEAILKLNAELVRSLHLKDEFLANVSHELRTPLTAVLFTTEALQEGIYGALDARQRKAVNRVENSGRHLLHLINDILELAKIESEKFSLELKPVEIRSICETSLQLFQDNIAKKRLKLTYTHDPKITMLLVDERRLSQILMNLVGNAVKFTPEEGELGLDVGCDLKENVVYFKVWDTGIGIAEKDKARLFQPFMQLDSGLARQYQGTGLGLALVYRLTKMHGGSVSLESVVNEGSKFTIAIPWRSGRTEPADFTEATVAARANKGSQVAAPLVFVLDDNPISIKTMETDLIALGYRVAVTSSSIDAVRQIAQQHPDLIFLDTRLPDLNCLEILRRVRAMPAMSRTPIITLSALTLPGEREHCLAEGATHYLAKPVSRSLLADILATWLNR